MRVEFTSDELILALISLVRAVNPAMLQQGPEGITFDFAPVSAKPVLNDDERLLVKLRVAFESPGETNPPSVQLEPAECRRLVETLARLEALQPWPADVLALSGNLRSRLAAAE